MTKSSISVEDAAWTAWLERVGEAYRLAYGERSGELHGRRSRTFDDRGVHPFSEAWGRLDELRRYLPEEVHEVITEGGELLDVWPVLLRQAGRVDAERDFRAELLAEASS